MNLNEFYNCLNCAISTHVCQKQKKNCLHPLWFDSKLINLKNRTNELRKRRHNSLQDEKDFKIIRTEYNRYTRIAYKNYLMEMEQLIGDDPINFFKHVSSTRNSKDELPYEMSYKEVVPPI